MQVPVLVLNYNGRRHLGPCFDSLAAEAQRDPRLEPWLIDNGSDDGSVSLVKQRFPQVRVVAHGANLGFAGGYHAVLNDEALLGRSPLVALLNNDVRVAPAWLAPLVDALAQPEVALCGSRLLSADGTRIDHAGGSINLLGGGIDLGKLDRATAHPAPAPPRATGFACGGALLLRRAAYLDLGGFDPRYVIYHEDVDLAWRAWLAGWRVLHAPASVVYHEGGALMGRPESPRRLFLSQRNRWRNLIRLSGTRRLVAGLGAAAGFDAARLMKFLWHGHGELTAALLRANRDVLWELPELLRARRRVQAERRRTDRELTAEGVFTSLAASVQAYQRLTRSPP